MNMRRHRQPLHAMSEMNVTNLLDTAFILLIVFMLVAPQLSQGVKVDLPQVVDAPAMEVPPEKTFLISIQKIDTPDEKEERVYARDQRVEMEDMKRMVKEERAAKPDLGIVIEADKNASWQGVSRVLNALAQVQVQRVGFKTIPVVGEEKTAPASSSKGAAKPVEEKSAARSAKKSGK
jgi:biopolymer transport protein ExbD